MEEMTLAEFIRNVLVQIHDGVTGANEAIVHRGEGMKAPFKIQKGTGDSRDQSGIHFDVAIQGVRAGEAKSGAEPAVLVATTAPGDASDAGEPPVHRVRFDVLPRENIS